MAEDEAPKPREVIIIDIDLPFWSMVWFMVKWSIATIPAVIIVVILAGFFWGIFGVLISTFFRELR
jgi:hypothetical protein